MDKLPEFIGNHTLLVVALMISFFVLVFTELRRKASGMVNISANEAVSLINNDAAVVDLRNADAYARGHIVNAKNIPFDEFAARKDTLSTSKPVVAVCDSGITSTKAVAMLHQSGFESAYSLKGGMNAWGQAGLPVVSGHVGSDAAACLLAVDFPRQDGDVIIQDLGTNTELLAGHFIDAPTYPFTHRRYWVERPDLPEWAPRDARDMLYRVAWQAADWREVGGSAIVAHCGQHVVQLRR